MTDMRHKSVWTAEIFYRFITYKIVFEESLYTIAVVSELCFQWVYYELYVPYHRSSSAGTKVRGAHSGERNGLAQHNIIYNHDTNIVPFLLKVHTQMQLLSNHKLLLATPPQYLSLEILWQSCARVIARLNHPRISKLEKRPQLSFDR